jgi:hypothetical protein
MRIIILYDIDMSPHRARQNITISLYTTHTSAMAKGTTTAPILPYRVIPVVSVNCALP